MNDCFPNLMGGSNKGVAKNAKLYPVWVGRSPNKLAVVEETMLRVEIGKGE